MLSDDESSKESEPAKALKDEPSSPRCEVPFEEVFIKEEQTEAADSDDDKTSGNPYHASALQQRWANLEEPKDPFDMQADADDPSGSKSQPYVRVKKTCFVTSPVIKEEVDIRSDPGVPLKLVDYSSSSSHDSFSEDDGDSNSHFSTTQDRNEIANGAPSSLFDFTNALETTCGSVSSDESENPSESSSAEGSTKKRGRNPSTWKSIMRKRAKNLGLEYISAQGKYVPPAKMRNPCACANNCVHKLLEEDRRKIFEAFWALGDRELRWDFIRKNSQVAPTKRRSNDQVLKRAVHRYFYFTVNQQQVKVCKTMFMATLGITEAVIVSAHDHVDKETGAVLGNQMGKHSNRPRKLTDEMIAGIVEHASLFPRIPRHESRRRTLREYLDGNLSVSAMAKLYAKWAAEKKLPRTAVASNRHYVDLLNGQFNIAFLAPKKEPCFLCHAFSEKGANRNLQEKYASLYPSHCKNREKAKCLKAKDVNDGVRDHSLAVFTYDLQTPALPCPQSESPCTFYRNKLSVSNLTFLNMIRRVGRCYVWHDGIGRRGSNETTSCVYQYIKDLVKCGYKEFRVWSSNSAGRNKNAALFAMYAHLAVRFSVKITHRYLEAGHTLMDTDTIHRRIEKATKKKEIFGFDQWLDEFEEVEKSFPPFEVEELVKSEIRSFKELAAKLYWEKDVEGNAVAWKKVREVEVDGSKGSLVRIKYELDGEPVTVNPIRTGQLVDLETYRAPQAYPSNVPISSTTAQHVRELLDSDSIPKKRQRFFREVLSSTDPTDEQVTDIEYDTEEEICLGEADYVPKTMYQ